MTSVAELMSRAVALHDAQSTLNLPYTYQLIKVPVEKRKAREQLGTMAAPMVCDMRDELMKEAVLRWLTVHCKDCLRPLEQNESCFCMRDE